MTDTERERLTTDQLAHPQGTPQTVTPDEQAPITADVERDALEPDPHATTTTEVPTTGPATLPSEASTQPVGDRQAPAQLLESRELAGVTSRWSDIQAAFVDSPQQAVQDADALVADLMQHLAQVFATERQQLEGQWSRGGTVSTEDLRVSLQRYRSFFQRLLSV
jgi:hypothetical protein